MEKLQEPINPCFLGDHLNVECFEQKFINTGALRFEEKEEEEEEQGPTLEDKMPFLQMLRTVETPSIFPFKEPKFQRLLRMETQIQALEFESRVTQKVLDLHSPVKSETKDLLNPHSTHSCLEGLSSESNQANVQLQVQPNSLTQQTRAKQTQFSKSPGKRKRKRTKQIMNKEEAESQRMTHIAVERNRRRQMNNHLNTIRSFMPPSYLQRGDQASVIGGAIDFVKELEQLLQSLEAQKRMRMGTNTATVEGCDSATSTSSNSTSKSNGYSKSRPEIGNREEKMKVDSKSDGAEIEVIVIQNHVNLKIHCTRRPGQLLNAIVALEELRLTFLHLNITSSETTVHYCFNLKIEEDCKLGSADEIAAIVHQTLSHINGS